MNKDRIIHIFTELRKLSSKDVFRNRSYGIIINILKTFEGSGVNGDITLQDLPILKNTKWIGKNSYEKIKEILLTGDLEELKRKKINKAQSNKKDEEKQAVIDLFLGILNVGEVTAKRWYKQGYRTLEDLKRNKVLTPTQAVGVKYYYDLLERIPREEIRCLYIPLINEILKNISLSTGLSLSFEITGSYRRGLKSSGDIDILITVNNILDPPEWLLELIVKKLQKEKLVTYIINIGSKKFSGLSSYSFVNSYLSEKTKRLITRKIEEMYNESVQSPSFKTRRIDIRLVPIKEWYTALLYFTGSVDFNIRMRYEAKRKGYLLNEHGIFQNGRSLKVYSEKDVFDILGIKYLEPEQR